MQCDYQIDDILRQTDEFLVYQATGVDGAAYTLTRLKYPDEVLRNLRDGRFEKALNELKRITHSCLRPIVDGGLDPVDHQPWIATRAWEGTALSDYTTAGSLTQADVQRVETHGKSLIAGVVENAGALDFRDTEVVLSTAINGEPIVTFSINYLVWFRDLAMGYQPGYKRDAKGHLQELLGSLNSVSSAPSSRPILATVAAAQVAPSSSPEPQVAAKPTVLASAKGGGSGLKSGLIIAVLTALIAAGVWVAAQMQKPKDTVDSVASLPEQSASSSPRRKLPKEVPPAKPASTSEPELRSELAVEEKKEVFPAPKEVAPVILERPSPGMMSEISADQASQLEQNISYWVIVKGQVKNTGNGREITFENSTLKALLQEGESQVAIGEDVAVIGQLKDDQTLLVENPDDIEVYVEAATLPKKQIYALVDEAQIRTLEGQEVTLEAIVKKVKASTSGKTLYLVFNDTKPEFAAGLRIRSAEEGLDRPYLESLEGKSIRVTGKVKLESGYGAGRLVIFFSKKNQLIIGS